MSGTLPAWMERLLGLAPGHEEGTVWSLEHRWGWPPWLTLLLIVAVAVFVVAVYLRERRRARRSYRLMLAAVRLAVVALVLLMIAQVSLSLKRTGLPFLAVIVDDSQSMSVVDRYDGERRAELETRVKRVLSDSEPLSRWNLARTLLAERDGALLAEMAENYRLRVYFLDDTPRAVRSCGTEGVDEILAEIRAIERPEVASTRLGTAWETVLDELRGSAPAAIVLLGDGINTEGPNISDVLPRRMGVPLLAVGLGSDEPVKDLKLADLLVDAEVFAGDVVHFELKLTATGLEGTQVAVTLRAAGEPEVLAKAELAAGPDGQPREIRLPYRPTDEGEFRFVVEVEPVEGELNRDNNRLQRTVRVHKEKIRVLLAQAYPSYEFRYLLHALQREETIDLDWILQDADLDYSRQDPAALAVFPVEREELFAYDVIILGDVNPSLLSASALQNLADFVDQPSKGGALVMIAGPKTMPAGYRGTPLARLLPIQLGSVRYPDPSEPLTTGFVAQPTELGLSSPGMQLGNTPGETLAIWGELAPLYWFIEAPDLKPAARVLLEHPTARGHDGRSLPLVTMQYVGAGKVLFHATDETYRWRRRVGDRYFARYWIQTIRYLSRAKLSGEGRSATLSTDRGQYVRGEPARLRVRFGDERAAPAEDDGVTVVLESAGAKTRHVGLSRLGTRRGDFEAELTNLPAGDYHAWVATPAMEGRPPAADFSVVPPPGEFQRVRMDRAALERAAKESAGRFYTFETARRVLDDLPPGRQVPIETLPPKPLWNRWPVLLGVLALLMAEWILRKRGGMV